MAGLEEPWVQFAELQRKLSDQAEALRKATPEQREDLSLAKRIRHPQTGEAMKASAIYVPQQQMSKNSVGS